MKDFQIIHQHDIGMSFLRPTAYSWLEIAVDGLLMMSIIALAVAAIIIIPAK